jgi:hypothetical protein
MAPILHTVVQILLSFAGAVAGGVVGVLIYDHGGATFFGPQAGLPPFLGAVAGFVGVYYGWARLAPIRRPRCGGRMAKSYEQGRRLAFRCPSCGG